MALVKTAKPNILTNMPPLWLHYSNISPHNRKEIKKKNKRMNNFNVYELQTMCYLQLWRRLSFCAGALHEDLPILSCRKCSATDKSKYKVTLPSGRELPHKHFSSERFLMLSTIWQLSKNCHMDLMPVA